MDVCSPNDQKRKIKVPSIEIEKEIPITKLK